MALNVGDKAPDFELVDTDLKMRTLDEFKGKKIVLSFIVAASSPVCEKELCTFRDGDYKSKTIRDYDVLMPDLLHVKDYNSAKRSVFIINEDGTIGYKWVSDDPLVEPNYDEIKKFLTKEN
jgi:peroxiredoxin